jgi:hypothetical protein
MLVLLEFLIFFGVGLLITWCLCKMCQQEIPVDDEDNFGTI